MARPNFLFFVTDQQRYDHVGYAGAPLLKTPNIDSLARNGAWFSKFYVSSPTCMSSRATFMTGRMPSLHGVRMNGLPLNLDSVSFVDLLRAAGYRTSLIGKCHIQSMLEAKSMVPEPSFPDGLEAPPSDLAEAMRNHHDPERYTVEMQEVWARTPNKAEQIELPYYGFDHVDFCMGHGDLVSGHYNNWLREQSGGEVGRGLNNARETSSVDAPQVYQPELSEEWYPTRYIGNQTISWLEQHATQSPDTPFFIQCSFPDPHHPFTPPGDYYSMYSPDDVALPDSFFAPNKDAIPPVRLLWDEYEAGKENKRWAWPFATGEAEARDITAKTFGQITMIDDEIGRVLAALDRLGLRENTVLVFFSDHGDYLGDHGLMLKGPMHYQSIIRVPFVWSDPDPSTTVVDPTRCHQSRSRQDSALPCRPATFQRHPGRRPLHSYGGQRWSCGPFHLDRVDDTVSLTSVLTRLLRSPHSSMSVGDCLYGKAVTGVNSMTSRVIPARWSTLG